jgi:hypothetical protein
MLSQSKRNILKIFLKETAFFCIPILALAPVLLRHQCFFANDLLGQFGPWWSFFKGSLSQNVFPLWNPYNFGGQPFAADPQSFAFYPFFYPFLILPIGWGLTAFWGFHLFLAARGVGKWLEFLGAPSTAQWFGGAVFALSGLFRVELIHPTIAASLAWLPWCFAYLEKTFHENQPRNYFLISCSYSMLFLCGSIQISLAGAYGLWLYAFIHFFVEKRHPHAEFSQNAIHCLWAFGAGILPVFLAALPMGEFVLHCSRNLHPQIYETFNSRGSLDARQFLTFLWPPSPNDLPLGEATQIMDSAGDNPLQALSGFLGPFAFFLAFLAIFRLKFRLTFPAIAIALMGLFWALGRHTPFHAWSCGLLPGFSSLQMPFRFICLFTLGISLLAGLGFQIIIRNHGNTRPWKRPSLLATILCLLGISLPLAVGWNFYITGPSKNYDFQANSLFMKHIEFPAPPYRILLTTSLPYRVWFDRQDFFLKFPVDGCAPMKLRSSTGYNPLCLENYSWLQHLPLDQFARIFSSPLLVSQKSISSLTGFRLTTSEPFFTYLLSPSTLAVKFPKQILLAPDDLNAFERMRSPGFDFEDQCVVTLPAETTLPSGGSSDGFDAKLITENAQHQIYILNAPRDGLAVFPDVVFPGWEAKLDGKKVPILTAQSALRSVAVPKGTHRLEFSFRPFWWPWIWIAIVIWFFATAHKILIFIKKPQAKT